MITIHRQVFGHKNGLMSMGMTGRDAGNDILAKARAQYAQCSEEEDQEEEEAGDDQGECTTIPRTSLLMFATLIQPDIPDRPDSPFMPSPPEEEDQDNGIPPSSHRAPEGNGSGDMDDEDPEGAFPAKQSRKRTSPERTDDDDDQNDMGDDDESDTRGGRQRSQRKPAKRAKTYVSPI